MQRTALRVAALVIAFPIAGCFLMFILAVRRAPRRGSDVLAFLSTWPRWGRLLDNAVFVYAAINCALFFRATGGGTLEERDGRTVLTDHGRVAAPRN